MRWIRRARASWVLVVLLVPLYWLRPLIFDVVTTVTPGLAVQPKLEVLADRKQVKFSLREAQGQALIAGVPWKAILYTPAGPLIARGLTDSGRTNTVSIRHVRAGVLAYSVIIGDDQWRSNGSVTRHPGLPITPLDLKVGARAARVVGNRPPALVLHPLDAQQNVSDEPILVRAERPDRIAFTRRIRVEHLTAWTYIPTGLRTGVLKISASSAGARGERAEMDVQPGPIAGGKLQAYTDSVPADRREWWDVRLEDGHDALGNAALNGTVIEFSAGINAARTRLFATRPTVRATASIDLPPTVTPGRYAVQASSEAYRSNQKILTARPPVTMADLAIRWATLRNSSRITLNIGPLVDRLGALPDDGTPVQLEVIGASNGSSVARGKRCDSRTSAVLYEIALPLKQGSLAWELPPLPNGSSCLRISVAGQGRVIELPETLEPVVKP
jgi:hypothetical protein